MNAKLHNLIDANFDELVTAVQKFIQFDSVADEQVDMAAIYPFGEKMADVLNAFLAYAASKGFAVKNIANAAGHAECGDGKNIIGILCHLDVVPTGSREQWKHDPFGGEIDGGRLYGRGSIDDKGPAVVSLYALKALKECGVELNHRYRLIVGLDEESGFSRCLAKYLESEEMPAYSFSPDAAFPVINAEKGILRFDINGSYPEPMIGINIDKITAGDRYNVVPDFATAYFSGDIAKAEALLQPLIAADCGTDYELKKVDDKLVFTVHGVAAHAMEPHKGKNALQIMMKKLHALYTRCLELAIKGLPKELATIQKIVGEVSTGLQFGVVCEDKASGALTCNAASLKFGEGKYSLRFDMRYPVSTDSAKLITNITDAVKTVGAETVIQQNKLPLHLPADMPFIQVLLSAYNDLTGEKGKPFSIGGGTYCRFLENSVSFGPIFPYEEATEHKPDEFVTLDSLRKMAHIYAEALYRINSTTI